MLASIAVITTPRPERYIKQLVSHLGHRATTSLEADGTGTVVLQRGQCTMSPQDGQLRLSATAADEESLAAVQDVIGRHLIRFATAEELRVTWNAAGAAG